jgi:hypothetical protein
VEEPKVADERESADRAQSCTLYLPTTAYREIWECVNGSDLAFSLDGSIDEWRRLVVNDDNTSLVLTSTPKLYDGDKASKILLGTINFFERINGPRDRIDRITQAVAACRMIVGVRGVPQFTDRLFDVIFEIAEKTNALIFNSSGSFD